MTITRSKAWLLSTMVPLALLAACASDEPPPLQGSGTSTAMPMQKEEIGGRPTLVYRAANVDLRRYTRFVVEPVDIYRGSDAKFEGASEEDKQLMAQFMRSEFVRVLGDRNARAGGPDVARLHLTLAGLEDNVPVVATATRMVPVGLTMNLLNSATDRPGSFTGATTIAGEVTDSQTGQVLVSFVQKRYPDALDIGATLSSRDAQRSAITDAAEGFRKQVDQAQATQR